MARQGTSNRWHSCHVLQWVQPTPRLWQFTVSNDQITLAEQKELTDDSSRSLRSLQRGWKDLWRPRLNVAWLPADHVYLRVVHLPKGEPDELQPMLELQLEKLSPAPINQIVWTYQPVVHPEPEQQSAIVIIAERNSVEAYLGQIEQQGYLADRLELPWLHYVLAGRPETDETCIYLFTREQKVHCLTAWWYGRTLRYLELFQLESNELTPSRVVDQLVRVAWAGEIEGWLSEPPQWRLIASESDVAEWEPALREKLGDSLATEPFPDILELAQTAARRSIRGESTANLMPPEHQARYRQEFVDRLWMRGLGAAIVAYMFLVLLYFAGVKVLEHQENRLQAERSTLANAYTNALQLKERVRVFAEQAELKYAALNSLRIASELLPPEIMLTSFTFQGGRSLRLAGTVAPDQQQRVTEYNAELRKATIDSKPLFDVEKYDAPSFQPQGNSVRWDFTADLNRTFAE